MSAVRKLCLRSSSPTTLWLTIVVRTMARQLNDWAGGLSRHCAMARQSGQPSPHPGCVLNLASRTEEEMLVCTSACVNKARLIKRHEA